MLHFLLTLLLFCTNKKIKENRINKAFIELFLSENYLDTPNYLYVKIRAHEKSGI